MITGAGGLLGGECKFVLGQRYVVFPMRSSDLDITDKTPVEEIIGSLKPDVIINCAAFTRVDDCESKRQEAFRINAIGAENVARSAHKYGALLVHISTDYVFDGNRPPPQPYTEEDVPSPINWYGHTKLKGEAAVEENARRYIILRTGWLYGSGGRNFPKTILRKTLMEPEGQMKVVDDQFGSPTWAHRLAHQVERLMASEAQGLYHATAEGYASWFQFAEEFLRLMGLRHSLSPCTSDKFPTPARRPANSILENKRLKNEGLNIMRHWKEDLVTFVSLNRDHLLAEAKGVSR
jgi:dTDP-4-dehydrorhamnose reductase